MTEKTWKQKLALIIPFLCIAIAGVLIVISTVALPSVLKSSIQEQLKMVPDTYQYWGQSPGMTKSVTKRNFTFFNFANPRDFLYRNKTPIFNQIKGFMLQQRFNFTDYKYSEDKAQVFFNDWLYFSELEGTRNFDQVIEVINVAPLGFWYQIDKVGMPTFALQGFGGLYVQLSETFKTQAIGQGVFSQFLPNYTNWRAVCNNSLISEVQCNNTWQDPQHGLSDQSNYQIWVEFAYLNESVTQTYLQTYFGFSNLQMNSIKSLFSEWSDTVNQILDNWFCDGQSCSSDYLTLLQLSSGNVTSNPPSGDAVQSICDTNNVTCIGQPEISKYLKNEFRQKFKDQKYRNLRFSPQTFKHLFTPYTGTLLNIGNLTFLFQTGKIFDSSVNIVERQELLSQIKQQAHAQTNDHAFVIWEWVKYFTQQFVLKLSKGGSYKNSGIGGVFAQAFYESFTGFGDWVLNQYLDLLGAEQIPDCYKFVSYIISNIPDEKVKSICSVIQSNKFGYSKLFQPCLTSSDSQEDFRLKNMLTINQFAQYCDQQQNSFYTVAMSLHQRIFGWFKCSQKKGVKICSEYELAMKQFINSSVTLNPIPNKIKTYEKSATGKSWNSQLSQFQYKNFVRQFYGDQRVDAQKFEEKELIDLLSFDKLFSASMVMELMLEQNHTRFQQLYHWKDMSLLKNFVRFVTIEVGFGGLTQKRTPRQLLFGYEDPFLKGLKQTDTMKGGDPSINPTVMLNQPNITVQQAYMFPQSVYTGQSDISLTRQYHTINNLPYITYNKTWYDGYNVQSQFVSPYRNQVRVKGTDSIQNPPNLDQKSSIYCLINNIYRTARLNYRYDSQMYNVDLLTFTVDESLLASQVQYPENAVYYQKFEGFHNISFLGVPLHISKNNLYSCPKNWTELITVYDEQGKTIIQGSIEDETVLKVQPNTGALFYASVRLQTNYHFESDVLFGPSSRMLPVNNIIRQGQIEESTVDQLFGALKTALGLKKALLIISAIIIPFSLIAIAYRCYKQDQTRLERKQIEESLIQVQSGNPSLITQSNTIISLSQQKTNQDARYQNNPKDMTKTQTSKQVHTILIAQEDKQYNVPRNDTFANINETVLATFTQENL